MSRPPPRSHASRLRPLWVAYLALLVVSRLWIELVPEERTPPPGARLARVSESVAGARGGPPVELAYRTLGPPRAEAVVLLHGSPGSLQDFAALAGRLGPERFVVVPDLAGFGHSQRSVPDHSFVAQADYLLQLLDHLGIGRAHLVAFSWGGGVAIELPERAPARVASLALVSALGVQELELLGRFELNRLVHAFQHALVVAIDWGVPHFGVLRGMRGYTRSFLDSDQRPLRPALEGWAGPLLVVHGERDSLVPPAAAREHARIVPQSRSVWIDGGHLVLWRHPERVAEALRDWLEDADAGRLPGRADASPERRLAAEAPFDRSQAGPQDGLGWLVFVLLVFAASMVSEDLTCAGVGLLVATGGVGFAPGVLACVIALVAGDLLLYLGGRLLGPPLLRRLGREAAEVGPIGERLQRSGGWVVLLGRFVPGARLPTYVGAGALALPMPLFTAWLIVAAALWAPLLVGLSALGGRALEMQDASPRTVLAVGGALVVAIAVAARIVPRTFSHRGRRLLLARWRRLARWEFWPIRAIYGLLMPSILGQALRHRSLRVVTLVNPPIEGGGLAGESKASIDALLARVPRHAIPGEVVEPGDPEARRRQALDFRASRGDGRPIVLKPDVGERGRGVHIAYESEDVERYLERHPGRTLIQEYVSGPEFGIFYVREPGAPTGGIFSLARKVPRFVEGDGERSLERLILADPICLPMAPALLASNRGRLELVPAAGERVQLTHLGTHSLGARFLVGEDLRTEALERAVDELSRTAGLDFGRYDVRSRSEAALRDGEFQVVEFNGLTAEAAHMYDPRYGLFEGLSILRDQWRLAFRVGAAHRLAGRRPLGWLELAALIRAARA